jgi:hypothetical protein
MRHQRRTFPLFSPAPLLAVGVLFLNDHVLKAIAPSPMTGKLSDVAGLVVFPLLVVSCIDLIQGRRVGPSRTSAGDLFVAVSLTGAVFSLIKLLSPAAQVVNEGLGVIQWLLTLGPIRGAAPTPTSMLVDPSDLIALPALLGSWWIARGREPRTGRSLPLFDRRWGQAAILLVVLAVTAATSPAIQSSREALEQEIRLQAGGPAFVQRLRIDVQNRDPDVGLMTLSTIAWVATADDDRARPEDVEVTLRPTRHEDGVRETSRYSMADARLDLTEACRASCRMDVILLVRSTGVPGGEARPVGLDTVLHVSGGEGQGAVDADLTLEAEVIPLEGEAATLLEANASGSLAVGRASPQAAVDVTITVAEDVLAAPLAFPLIGEIALKVETTDTVGNGVGHNTVFDLPGEDDARLSGEASIAWDLFRYCVAGEECVIPIVLRSAFEDEGRDVPGAPRSIDVGWSVDVRVYAHDGRALPPDGLTIEVLDE